MRLFVAVEIDDALKDKLTVLQTKLAEPGTKIVERENLHVTLKFIGEVPTDQIEHIRTALHTVKMAPFHIDIGGVGTFPPSGDTINVVWVDCKGPLAELAAKVEGALKPLGVRQEDRGFVSHLTIARVKQTPIRLRERVEELANTTIGTQRVDGFVLKSSTLTPRGPIYENVEVYRLS